MDLIDVEEELRRHLADRGDGLEPAPRDLAARTRVLHRLRRRRQLAVAGACLTVLVVFGSIPALRGLLPEVGSTGDVAAPSSSAPLPSLYDLPARGSLAGDADWLGAVAALPWTPTIGDQDTDPPVDSHRVSYAADVPGARVALVMGREDAVLSAAWFVGPAGAAPSEMAQATASVRAFPDQPMTLVDTPDPTGSAVLVVVSRPGDEAEYTDGLSVSAAGEEVDDVARIAMTDGAGFLQVSRPGGFLSGQEVRVQRDGEQAYTLYPTVSDRAVDAAFAVPVDIADPRGLRGGVDPDWLQGLAKSALSRYGSGAEGVTPVLLAAGAVPGEGDPHVAMVGLTFPSGATTAWAVRYRTVGDRTDGVTTSLSPLPAGVALLDRTLGIRVDGALAVSAPAGAVTGTALATDGTVVATSPLTGGSAVVGVPVTPAVTSMRVQDAAGVVLAEVPVTGTNG